MTDRPVAIITGAAGGIGRATVLELAQRGYDLALLDIRTAAVEEIGEQVRSLGARRLVMPGDLADLNYIQVSVDQIHRHFGRIDLLVNNAAWRKVQTMRQTSIETWDKTFRICVTAPAFLAKYCATAMEPQKRGVIINVSSIRAEASDGTATAYVVCKGALLSLTHDLAALYGPRGIRVLTVSPGAIDTELSHDLAGDSSMQEVIQAAVARTPLGRLGQAEEVARTIAMLASDDASFITGTTITIDGGYTRNPTAQNIKQLIQPDEFS